MNPVVIPDVDPVPLPAPVWLLRGLLYLTFILHIFPMNLVLGGGLLAVVSAWIGRRHEREDATRLARQIANVLPAATALTITLGVPPLLFLQVLYGPLFYTSSVLMAWPWLAVVVFLMLGYYGYYYFSLRADPERHPPIWAGLIASILFVLIGFMYSNNMTLMIQPEKFWPIYQKRLHGLVLNLGDAMLWPRYLHFFVGAVAISGLLVVIIGLIHRRREPDYGDWAVQFGGLVFVIATIVQFIIGIWQLLVLRREVMLLFMGQHTGATLVFGAAVLFALVAMMLLLVAALGKSPVGMSIAGMVLIGITVALMAIMRGIVRDAYLGTHFRVTEQMVAPQWLIVGIFAVLLVGGVILVGWMTHAVVTRRGAPAA